VATAVQVVIDGHGHTVVRDIRSAFEHIARSIAPNGDYWKDMGGDGVFPMLSAVGEGGSYCHRVRYAVQGEDGVSVEVVTHDLDRAPGRATAVSAYDLMSQFDPSYVVSRYLFNLSTRCPEGDLGAIGDDIEEEIEDGIHHGRKLFEPDDAFVDRLRGYQRDFGGPEVIPAEGDAAEILNSLPSLARAKFEEIVARAFPEATRPTRP